jgi:UDP-N-acetylglucosamine transferase subunit ALG13
LKETIKINNSPQQKLKVLIAPLDWGLGHATRCIPIINELLSTGCEVIIASERGCKALLQLEFPSLRFIELGGYRLKYGKNHLQTLLRLFFQIPKILIQIKRENSWLKRLLETERLDAVIADNRYGLYSSKLFSVFITHQLCIQTPFGKVVERKLQKINYRFINKFDCCWVPDFEKENALAGKLSHPKKLPPVPVQYIGLLSRFEKMVSPVISKDLLVLISGPEPQRTIFEKLVWKQLISFNGKATVVRGMPGQKHTIPVPDHVDIYNHLSSGELNRIICESAFIISRSGYSTIMDLVKLGSKSILVPTPGQAEQEYLAAHLSKNKIAMSYNQQDFLLPDALEKGKHFPYMNYENLDSSLLKKAIEDIIKKLS